MAQPTHLATDAEPINSRSESNGKAAAEAESAPTTGAPVAINGATIGQRLSAASRSSQGLPFRVVDPVVLARVARLFDRSGSRR